MSGLCSVGFWECSFWSSLNDGSKFSCRVVAPLWSPASLLFWPVSWYLLYALDTVVGRQNIPSGKGWYGRTRGAGTRAWRIYITWANSVDCRDLIVAKRKGKSSQKKKKKKWGKNKDTKMSPSYKTISKLELIIECPFHLSSVQFAQNRVNRFIIITACALGGNLKVLKVPFYFLSQCSFVWPHPGLVCSPLVTLSSSGDAQVNEF